MSLPETEEQRRQRRNAEFAYLYWGGYPRDNAETAQRIRDSMAAGHALHRSLEFRWDPFERLRNNADQTTAWGHSIANIPPVRFTNNPGGAGWTWEFNPIRPIEITEAPQPERETMSRASMTRQHFEAIGDAIASIQGLNRRRAFCDVLIPVMRRFNSSFDEGRFKNRCRVSERTANTGVISTGRGESPALAVQNLPIRPNIQNISDLRTMMMLWLETGIGRREQEHVLRALD